MKQMFATSPAHRQPPSFVRSRVESALDRLADRYVLILDSLAHVNARHVRSPGGLRDVREVEIKHNLGLVHATRNHQVRVHRAVVPIDHKVRIDPVIQCTIPFSHSAGLRFGTFAYKWTPLQTMMLSILDLVVAVIEHAVQTLVQIGHVITAVEIVVDEDLPVAIEVIVPALEPMEVCEFERCYLLN